MQEVVSYVQAAIFFSFVPPNLLILMKWVIGPINFILVRGPISQRSFSLVFSKFWFIRLILSGALYNVSL